MDWTRRPLVLAFSLLTAWGCADKSDDAASKVPEGPPPSLIAERVQAHGELGFYFLEPLVTSPTTEGYFGGSLSPIVRIDELSSEGEASGRSVATFTRTAATDAERIRVEGNAYVAAWDAAQSRVDTVKKYRVRVFLDGRELGSADVAAGPTTHLPIRFFLNGCAPIVCEAQDACHEAGTCDPLSLRCSNTPKPDGTACSDSNECTQNDVCQAGACVAGTPVTCAAGDACHDVGTCDRATGRCVAAVKADGTTCDDDNPCTQSDVCIAGACRGSVPVECGQPDGCHETGACDRGTGACVYANKPDGSGCSDVSACSQSDVCRGGACLGGPPVVCPPPDQCHQQGACDSHSGTCIEVPKADGTPCDDGNACTTNDQCVAGACTGGAPISCTAIDACHDTGTCDTSSGSCSAPPRSEGSICDGGYCNSSQGPFTCVPHNLAATHIAPDLGDIHGGVRVVVDVRGEVSSVRIGNRDCNDLVRLEPSRVECTAPALSPGNHDVTVSDGRSWGPALRSAYEAWHPTVDFADARVFQSDRDVTAAGHDARCRIGFVSANVKGAATNEAVDGAGFFRLSSGRLLLLGGAPAGHAYQVVNTVWYSDDDGKTWAVLLEHDPLATSRFKPGHTMGFAVHTHGGVAYAYVIGGDPFAPNGEVWRTPLSGDGTTWTRVATTAPTQSLVLSMAFSYQGALYIAGGQRSIHDLTSASSTVYRSTDGGATWTSLGEAPWAPRGMVLGQLPEHDGLIYLVGGGVYDGTETGGSLFYNDVWTFDGTVWRQVLANGHTQFPVAYYHSIVEHGSRLWIINGVTTSNVELASIHSSADGRSWSAIDTPLPWGRTHAQSALSVDGGILVTEAFQSPRLFKILPHDGALVSSWSDQGSAHLLLSQADNASKPVLDPHAFGAMPGLAFTGKELMMLPAADGGMSGGIFEAYFIGRTRNLDVAASMPMDAPATVIGNSTDTSIAGFGFSGGSLRYTQYAGGWQTTERGSGFDDDRARLYGARHTGSAVTLFVGASQVDAADTTNVTFYTGSMAWNSVGAGYRSYDRAAVVLGAVVLVRPARESSPAFLAKLDKWARKWGVTD